MDLSTKYLGFNLPHPLIPGASPLVDDLDTVRRLEDAGAPMIVMHSLFEEQIVGEQLAVVRSMEMGDESYAEALSYLPRPAGFVLGPDEYLRLIARIKSTVSVPVIASLNGVTDGGWIAYARLIEQAGADGLELNIYELATDLNEAGEQIDRRTIQVAKAVKQSISIPVAVKLSPFYSSLAHLCKELDELSADALVLFNRFYQPDIDVEQLEVLRSQSVDVVRVALATAVAGHSLGQNQGVIGRHRWSTHRHRCHQGGDGRERTACRWSLHYCNTAPAISQKSVATSGAGWKSTNTSP